PARGGSAGTATTGEIASRSKLHGDPAATEQLTEVLGRRGEGGGALHCGEDGVVELGILGALHELGVDQLTGAADADPDEGLEPQALLVGKRVRKLVVALDLRGQHSVVALSLLGRGVAVGIAIFGALELLRLLVLLRSAIEGGEEVLLAIHAA